LARLPLRVYIVSETLLFSEGLKAMLTRKGGLDVVGHGRSGDAPEDIRHLAPELVLLDMAGPDSLDVMTPGLEAGGPPFRAIRETRVARTDRAEPHARRTGHGRV